MNNQKIEFVGTIVLPEFTEEITYELAFHRAGITASKLFKTMFFDGGISPMPSKAVDCYRAVNRIDNLDLENILGDNFRPLEPADIWRLFYLNGSSEIKLKNNGACNMVLIANGSKKVWRAQIFNSRHTGWKAELYNEPRLFYDELIFSEHQKE